MEEKQLRWEVPDPLPAAVFTYHIPEGMAAYYSVSGHKFHFDGGETITIRDGEIYIDNKPTGKLT